MDKSAEGNGFWLRNWACLKALYDPIITRSERTKDESKFYCLRPLIFDLMGVEIEDMCIYSTVLSTCFLQKKSPEGNLNKIDTF